MEDQTCPEVPDTVLRTGAPLTHREVLLNAVDVIFASVNAYYAQSQLLRGGNVQAQVGWLLSITAQVSGGPFASTIVRSSVEEYQAVD